MGAKQAYVKSCQNHIVKIINFTSTSNSDEESLTKRSKEKGKKDKSSSLLSSDNPQKNTVSSPPFQSGSFDSGHTRHNTSVLPAKTLSRDNQVGKGSKSDSNPPKKASKTNSGSLSCHTAERNRTGQSRRPVAVPDDIDELFTPDPITYVIPCHKTAKSNINREIIKSPTTEQCCSSRNVASSSNAVSGSLCHKAQNITVTGSPPAVDTQFSSLSSACHQQISFPAVTLEGIKLENSRSSCPLDNKLLKDEVVKSDEEQLSPLPSNVGPCTLETDTTASQEMSTSHYSQPPLLKRQISEGGKPVSEEDPIDVELDLGLSFALDLDLTQSSHSSEEEQLLSFQEMMERVTKPPDIPEKEALSKPSAPEHHQSKPVSYPWLLYCT